MNPGTTPRLSPTELQRRFSPRAPPLLFICTAMRCQLRHQIAYRQEAQLSQTDRATLRAFENVAESLAVTQSFEITPLFRVCV